MLLTADTLRAYLVEAVDNKSCTRDFANELLDYYGITLITQTFNFSVEYKYVRIVRGTIEAVDKDTAKELIADFIDDSDINIITRVKTESLARFDFVEVDETDDDGLIEEENLYSSDCLIEIWED